MGDDVLHISASGVLEQRHHPGVASVDVLAQLQLAGVVHECGLIGDVDRDRRREIDVRLAAAIHAADFFRRVFFVRQHDVEQGRTVLIGFCTRMQPWLKARSSLANRCLSGVSC